ncbi:MAG: hypothetical protein ACYTXA_13460 [Nostoc sp.]
MRTSLRDPSLRDAALTASSGHRAARTASSVTIVDIACLILVAALGVESLSSDVASASSTRTHRRILLVKITELFDRNLSLYHPQSPRCR